MDDTHMPQLFCDGKIIMSRPRVNLLDVYNYYVPEKTVGGSLDGLLECMLWDTAYDIPKMLRVYAMGERSSISPRSLLRNHVFIEFRDTSHNKPRQDYKCIWSTSNIDSTLYTLMMTFVDQTSVDLHFGLICERLEETGYIILAHMCKMWYDQAMIKIQRPNIKDHKLKLYVPCN